MNYYIKRNDQEFGPYSLIDLQRYLASGNIVLTDLARAENMSAWVPLPVVLASASAPPPPVGAPSAAVPAYGAPVSAYPLPPELHWALVLLLSFVTCGIFQIVWFYVQASFVQKLVPECKAALYFTLGMAAYFVGIVGTTLMFSAGHTNATAILPLCQLAGVVLLQCGNFSMKGALEQHYNTSENIGLTLSGVMTFFFSVIYFQYHFNQIRAMRLQQQAYQAYR